MSKLSLFLLTLVMTLSLTGRAAAVSDGGSRPGKVRFAASADICNSWFHRVYGPDGEQIDMSSYATGSLTAGVSLFDRRLYVGLGFTKLDNDPIRPALQTTWNVLPSRFTPFVDLNGKPDSRLARWWGEVPLLRSAWTLRYGGGTAMPEQDQSGAGTGTELRLLVHLG